MLGAEELSRKETFPMSTLLIAALLGISAIAAPPDTPIAEADFATALGQSLTHERPLVVLVGADWCPACRRMKTKVLPQAASAGTLGEVEFAYVNTDRQPELAGRLLQSGSVPQLIRLEKTAAGWVRDRLVGAQSVKKVTSFILGDYTNRPAPEGPSSSILGWGKQTSADN
jgi:thioredoxin-like negative regulator of GroEL